MGTAPLCSTASVRRFGTDSSRLEFIQASLRPLSRVLVDSLYFIAEVIHYVLALVRFCILVSVCSSLYFLPQQTYIQVMGVLTLDYFVSPVAVA